jgi:two-component system, chemotaxis family, response regulator Rcp1
MKVDTIAHKGRPAEILLIEDNHGDVLLTKKAFNQAKIANHITVAKSGEEAMKILHREGEHANARVPDLILLDLNLPKKSGKEILAEIKAEDHLKHIPVVILTSSRAELDVVKTYDLHANSYIIKPVNLEKFGEIVSAIESYWFTIVVLPEEEAAQKVGS